MKEINEALKVAKELISSVIFKISAKEKTAARKVADYLTDTIGYEQELKEVLSEKDYTKLNNLVKKQDRLMDEAGVGGIEYDWLDEVGDFIYSERMLRGLLEREELLDIVKQINDILSQANLEF